MLASLFRCPLAPRGHSGTLILATAILASGCASMPRLPFPLAGVEKDAGDEASASNIAVEMRSSGGKSVVKSVPLTEDLHVGDALARSGALKRFNRVNVHVIRASPSGELAKLNVVMAPNRKQVRAEHDYLLREGDRILVKESDEGGLGELMSSLLPG